MFSHPSLNKKLITPTVLNDQSNGSLSSNSIFKADIQGAILTKEAAYAWAALVHNARHSSEIYLGAVSSYRTYEEQLNLVSRLSATPSTEDLAATPGLSNHGLGLAIDVGSMIGSYISPSNLQILLNVQHPSWQWLSNNLEEFGFGFEYNDQPWHIVYQAGDVRTKKVQYFLDSVKWSRTEYQRGYFAFDSFITSRYLTTNDIKYMQSVLLFGKRFSSSALAINGIFDQITKDCLKKLQDYYGLAANGIPDKNTWYAVSHEAVGMTGKNIWPKKKITIYINDIDKPVSKLIPNVKPAVSQVDWTQITGVTSSTFQHTAQEMQKAYRKIADHPNMWATKKVVWGKRYGYTYEKNKKSVANPENVYKVLYSNASCPWSPFAKIKMRQLTDPSTGQNYTNHRTFMFPALLNFLWIAMEVGFIFDFYNGSTGSKAPGVNGSHQIGVAIDFARIGHVNYNGAFPWDATYADDRARSIRSIPLEYRGITVDPETGKKNIDGYNLRASYIDILSMLKTLSLSLPEAVRPYAMGSPLYEEECKQLGLSPFIYKDVNPNHIHIDFTNGLRGVSLSKDYNRFGLLLPDLIS